MDLDKQLEMEAKIIFRQIDTDGSGTLDESEFMTALGDWGMDDIEG